MSYEEITRLGLERGFLLPSCEVYSDAPAGFWDYGPLGIAFRNRYVELWRKELVRRDGMIETDGSQIMSKNVFQASGHLEGFSDPIVTCVKCRATHRADRLVTEKAGIVVPERLDTSNIDEFISDHNLRCPNCGGELGKVKRFNMMFRVGIGAADEDAYLRPETCQSIFVDFPRLFKVMRAKLPIALAQFGKSFRNEIAPRQSLMRLREFYQAEIEVFFDPEASFDNEKFSQIADYNIRMSDKEGVKDVSCRSLVESGTVPKALIAYYLALLQQLYEKTGIDMQRTRFRRLADEEKAFYSTIAFDFEVQTSLGWIELVACNYRGDYDLSRHSAVSRQDFTVFESNRKVLPHIFELSMGVDRSLYCILEHSFKKENERDVLMMRPYLAPVQVGVFSLVNKDGLPEKAKQIRATLRKDFDVVYDESGSIGRRYRRADEVGVPLCVTVDYKTLEDDSVTVRSRDTMLQERVKIVELHSFVSRRLFSIN